jgi:hypothetical protein
MSTLIVVSTEAQAVIPQLAEKFEAYDTADRAKGLIGLEVGRLILPFAPVGERGKSNGNGDMLKYFAQETDWSVNRLTEFRNLADALAGVSNEALVKEGKGRFSFEVLNTVAKSTPEQRKGTEEGAERSYEEFLTSLTTTNPGTKSGRWTAEAVKLTFYKPESEQDTQEPVQEQPVEGKVSPFEQFENIIASVEAGYSHEVKATADISEQDQGRLVHMVALPNLTDEQVSARWVEVAHYAMAQAKAFEKVAA